MNDNPTLATEPLIEFLDMLNRCVQVPSFAIEEWDKLAALLRHTSPVELYQATCLLWLHWDGRGKFRNYFFRNQRKAVLFVRSACYKPQDWQEWEAFYLLFSLWQALRRIGKQDSLPYSLHRLRDYGDILLENWPGYAEQKDQWARESVEADLHSNLLM